MTGAEHNRRMDAARVHAELTVQDLWLRYVGLGGTGDAFDVDGYLQALLPLDTPQQDVLAQALNEGLWELYQAHCVPLSALAAGDESDDRLSRLVAELLHPRSPSGPDAQQPGGDDTS